MKPEEFCQNCEHHYSFHNGGKGKCEKLYPPRTIDFGDGMKSVHDNVNHCWCEMFKV